MEQERKDIIYKTSDLQALYGLSNKGLFFYEGQGLITPERTSGNNYRVYTLEETARIHRCKVFRQMGFSVDESINMVCSSTPDSLLKSLSERQQELKRQIIWQDLVSNEISRQIELIGLIEQGAIPFQIGTRPLMRRISLRNTNETAWTKESAQENQNWQQYLPVAEASLRVYPEEFTSVLDEIQVNLGFAILEESLQQWGENLDGSAELLPDTLCLYTILSGSDFVLNSRERFAPALKWIKENGYQLSGAVITRMIATMDKGDGMMRYDEAWFPISIVN